MTDHRDEEESEEEQDPRVRTTSSGRIVSKVFQTDFIAQ